MFLGQITEFLESRLNREIYLKKGLRLWEGNYMKVLVLGDQMVMKCIQGNFISVGIIDFPLLEGLPMKM